MELLLIPFSYTYMIYAIFVAALVGGSCAFLSSYVMLRGWSLIGNTLGHAVVPGVVLAYLFQFPYSIGAFFAGALSLVSMLFIKITTNLREDSILGIIATFFLAIGLLLKSINPIGIDTEGIIFGNILTISRMDVIQITILSMITLSVLTIKWKDFMLIFFDEVHARNIGLRVYLLHAVFFMLLSFSAITALKAVGAFLVIAMLIVPGASAYMLTDRFGMLIIISVIIGVTTSSIGAYTSFFLDINTGANIIVLQTLIFLTAFLFAPKHGFLRKKILMGTSKNSNSALNRDLVAK